MDNNVLRYQREAFYVKVEIFQVMTQPHFHYVIRMSFDFKGGSLSCKSAPFQVCRHGSSASGDIMILICHVNSQGPLIARHANLWMGPYCNMSPPRHV